MQDSPSSLPFRTGLESRVPAHEVGEVRMELIFGSHSEFESVQDGDEGLATRKDKSESQLES